ncbi:MAG: hypothetical protein M3299_11935 [Thermoproteota archaeon]|nr:hypothetical protein [Thermoproteota archaeon]
MSEQIIIPTEGVQVFSFANENLKASNQTRKIDPLGIRDRKDIKCKIFFQNKSGTFAFI